MLVGSDFYKDFVNYPYLHFPTIANGCAIFTNSLRIVVKTVKNLLVLGNSKKFHSKLVLSKRASKRLFIYLQTLF